MCYFSCDGGIQVFTKFCACDKVYTPKESYSHEHTPCSEFEDPHDLFPENPCEAVKTNWEVECNTHPCFTTTTNKCLNK